MNSTVYLTLDELFELHEALIERFGGSEGIRDKGALESALYRPQTGHYESLSLQAAALLQSLLMNHGFVDGNKRVAFSAAAIFLRMNGFVLRVDAKRAERFIIDEIIVGKVPLSKIASWIEAHVAPR